MSDTNDQPGGSTGLLDNVTPEDTSKPADTQKVEINHKAGSDPAAAATDTGAPKTRPDYLPENFWNNEKGEADLEAMSKSWSDLRKQISQGKHKAPADGKYDLKALGENAEANPLTQTLLEMAKEEGLSQSAFDKLATTLAAQAAPEIDTAAGQAGHHPGRAGSPRDRHRCRDEGPGPQRHRGSQRHGGLGPRPGRQGRLGQGGLRGVQGHGWHGQGPACSDEGARGL